MNTLNIQELVVLIPPILLALTFHEFMHGWVAFKLGDPTARNAGRLSMNPMVHLDPIGTLMILIVHFGWAKPVPVNSYNLENPKKDLMLISLAGPLANMFLALISGILIRIILAGGLNIIPMTILKPLFMMIRWSLMINVALAFFNLIPIPPLDGSKILFGILPAEKEYIVRNLNQYGPFILLGLIVFGLITNVSIIGVFLNPFIMFFSKLFGGI